MSASSEASVFDSVTRSVIDSAGRGTNQIVVTPLKAERVWHNFIPLSTYSARIYDRLGRTGGFLDNNGGSVWVPIAETVLHKRIFGNREVSFGPLKAGP